MTLASDQKLDTDGLSETSRRMLALREVVLKEWEVRVRKALTEAQEMRHPVFINTLPAFYDDLVEAVTPGYPRANANACNNLASEHGGERARLSQYDPDMLILEYQLFKDTILDTLAAHHVPLNADELHVIHTSIDGAIREAVTAFSLVLAEMREQFLASLTHDMRTPLGSASMAAELIFMAADNDRTRELARKVTDNLTRVDRMIQSLLDSMLFKHGEQLQLTITEFDLAEVAREACEACDAANAGRSGRCELTGAPAPGWWDRDAVRRALENLIGNALKYGQADGQVRVNLAVQHGRVIVSVHNEGTPIPAEEQEAIFQIFRRAQQTDSHKKTGWGVGLPYVRTVAEAHGGSVVVDSAPTTGTTFMIDLPLDARPFQHNSTQATA